METNKIDYIEGEPFCRYNGILMDEQGCLDTFGYNEDLGLLDDDTILIDDKLYSDKDFCDIIKLIGDYNDETPEWDVIYHQDFEPSVVSERRKLDGTYTIHKNSIEMFEGIRTILPFKQFKQDYPQISIEKYQEFENAMDDYIKNKCN